MQHSTLSLLWILHVILRLPPNSMELTNALRCTVYPEKSGGTNIFSNSQTAQFYENERLTTKYMIRQQLEGHYIPAHVLSIGASPMFP